jgi:glycerol-3-phosphate acyltransferase PlsY
MDHSSSGDDAIQLREDMLASERMINVRKLAALDIAFHGPRFILIEFGLGVFGCAAFGLFSLYFAFLHGPAHALFAAIIGCCLLWIALNYVPLLLYAIALTRRKSVQQEVAFELAHRDRYARKYTLQSTLILVPFAILLLAAYQELQKRGK